MPTNYPEGVTSYGVPVIGGGAQIPATTGTYFFVSSGATRASNNNAGTDPEYPCATIDGAINKCTANKNDVIVVMPGHAETIAAAAGIDADIAGITIVGLGNGANKPTVTFATSTAADVDIDAANIRISNIRFVGNIASQTAMIDVNSTGFQIDNCEFLEGSATGLTMIDINGGGANACDYAVIRDNLFYSTTAGNFDRAIELGEVADRVQIVGNIIVIDADDAGIHNPTGKVLTQLNISRNYVTNLQSGQHAVELVSACTGTAFDNRFSTDASTTAFDAGALSPAGNLWNAVSAGDSEGVAPNPAGDAATNFIGVDDADNAVATTNVVANVDGSVLERVEFMQRAVGLLAADYRAANYLSVTADMTSATWNTVAAHEIATITGAVRILILPQCTGTLTSGGNSATLILGDETTTNSIISSSDAENLATGEWWADATMTRTLLTKTLINGLDLVIGAGKDIGYTIGTEALTGGSIIFHMWWVPIDATGSVAAGAGGVL